MAITTTWQIDWMQASTQEINGFTEVVLSAGWRCNGTDGSVNASNYGSASFPEPTKGGEFTPYTELTQDEVLGWCWANGVDKTATEESVTNQVETLANPPVVQPPLPWATANVTTETSTN